MSQHFTNHFSGMTAAMELPQHMEVDACSGDSLAALETEEDSTVGTHSTVFGEDRLIVGRSITY